MVFSTVAVAFKVLLAMYKDSNFSICSPTLVILQFFVV